jgi:hypothetical protein
MKRVVHRIKPAKGFSRLAHQLLKIILPIVVFICVRIDFTQLAVALVLLSKWRMFAVKPRHWLANIRANGVDIIVGLSFVAFMHYSASPGWELIWAVVYGLWLVFLKPRSETFWVVLQAAVGQTMGLIGLYLLFNAAPIYVLVVATWAICYIAARHFLTAFHEVSARPLTHLWAYFAAALTWVLAHWLLFYGILPQVVLLLSVIGYGLGATYFLAQTDRYSVMVRRQLLLMMSAIILIIIIFSDWGDKAI